MIRILFSCLALLGLVAHAQAGDLSMTLTTTPATVVDAGYHSYIAVKNEGGVSIACSFFTPAPNTAGSYTIAAGGSYIWSYGPAIPQTAPLQCVAASTTAAITVETASN